MNYKGTLLLVSHDREFLDHVVTSTFVLEGDGEVDCYPGGYDDYVRQRKSKESAANPSRVPDDSRVPPVAPAAAASSPKKLSYKEQRELEALPAQIEALEKEIADINASDPVKEYARYAKLPALESELETLVDRWAALAERQILV